MTRSIRTTRRVVLGSLFALALTAAAPSLSQADDTNKKEPRIGLEGYCPVCIIDGKKWMKGSPDHEVTYDGITYRFPEEGAKKKFEADPAKYVPALGGDCIVCYAKAGKRVPGSVHHAAFHAGRLFLFPSDKEKKVFLDDAKKFAGADLALKGNCAVCLAMMKKDVPGKAEFTAIHHGFRYLFPSDKERKMFLAEPAKFEDKSLAGTQQASVTVSGKTACAGCEFGVTPLGAPEELGLAVTAADGSVFVIEDAHKRWPSIYEGRFSGKTVKFTGKVLQRRGKIAWVQAEELSAI